MAASRVHDCTWDFDTNTEESHSVGWSWLQLDRPNVP
jgi:hypothetical protein